MEKYPSQISNTRNQQQQSQELKINHRSYIPKLEDKISAKNSPMDKPKKRVLKNDVLKKRIFGEGMTPEELMAYIQRETELQVDRAFENHVLTHSMEALQALERSQNESLQKGSDNHHAQGRSLDIIHAIQNPPQPTQMQAYQEPHLHSDNEQPLLQESVFIHTTDNHPNLEQNLPPQQKVAEVLKERKLEEVSPLKTEIPKVQNVIDQHETPLIVTTQQPVQEQPVQSQTAPLKIPLEKQEQATPKQQQVVTAATWTPSPKFIPKPNKTPTAAAQQQQQTKNPFGSIANFLQQPSFSQTMQIRTSNDVQQKSPIIQQSLQSTQHFGSPPIQVRSGIGVENLNTDSEEIGEPRLLAPSQKQQSAYNQGSSVNATINAASISIRDQDHFELSRTSISKMPQSQIAQSLQLQSISQPIVMNPATIQNAMTMGNNKLQTHEQRLQQEYVQKTINAYSAGQKELLASQQLTSSVNTFGHYTISRDQSQYPDEEPAQFPKANIVIKEPTISSKGPGKALQHSSSLDIVKDASYLQSQKPQQQPKYLPTTDKQQEHKTELVDENIRHHHSQHHKHNRNVSDQSQALPITIQGNIRYKGTALDPMNYTVENNQTIKLLNRAQKRVENLLERIDERYEENLRRELGLESLSMKKTRQALGLEEPNPDFSMSGLYGRTESAEKRMIEERARKIRKKIKKLIKETEEGDSGSEKRSHHQHKEERYGESWVIKEIVEPAFQSSPTDQKGKQKHRHHKIQSILSSTINDSLRTSSSQMSEDSYQAHRKHKEKHHKDKHNSHHQHQKEEAKLKQQKETEKLNVLSYLKAEREKAEKDRNRYSDQFALSNDKREDYHPNAYESPSKKPEYKDVDEIPDFIEGMSEFHHLELKCRVAKKQTETLKQDHEEMRQRCARVLGSYNYIEELQRQIYDVDTQLQTEHVIKGKLTYLQKMFEEIDLEKKALLDEEHSQMAMEQLLTKIGDVSGRCDHMIYEIKKLGHKLESIQVIKEKLEIEVKVMTEKAQQLHVLPLESSSKTLITEEQLLFKQQKAKLEAEILKAKEEKESKNTIFQIKMSKFTHDEMDMRRDILAKQSQLSQKLRINENQRRLIMDLMKVYEVVDTIAKGRSGDVRELPFNERGEPVLPVHGQNTERAEQESELDDLAREQNNYDEDDEKIEDLEENDLEQQNEIINEDEVFDNILDDEDVVQDIDILEQEFTDNQQAKKGVNAVKPPILKDESGGELYDAPMDKSPVNNNTQTMKPNPYVPKVVTSAKAGNNLYDSVPSFTSKYERDNLDNNKLSGEKDLFTSSVTANMQYSRHSQNSMMGNETQSLRHYQQVKSGLQQLQKPINRVNTDYNKI